MTQSEAMTSSASRKMKRNGHTQTSAQQQQKSKQDSMNTWLLVPLAASVTMLLVGSRFQGTVSTEVANKLLDPIEQLKGVIPLLKTRQMEVRDKARKGMELEKPLSRTAAFPINRFATEFLLAYDRPLNHVIEVVQRRLREIEPFKDEHSKFDQLKEGNKELISRAFSDAMEMSSVHADRLTIMAREWHHTHNKPNAFWSELGNFDVYELSYFEGKTLEAYLINC